MSDNRLRPAFKTEDGLPKCIDLLHSCLDDKDWNLACLGMNNQDIICIWHLRVSTSCGRVIRDFERLPKTRSNF